MPKRSISMVCARTMSGMVMIGKSSPHNLPVAGLVDAGPVEPIQPPITFEQNNEIPVGIERTPGTDHGFPPAGFAGHRMDIGDMLIAGQRMEDQNGIGTFRIELAVGLVRDLERRKIDAAIKPQRPIYAERGHQRTRMIRLVRSLLGMDRRTWYRLHVYHLHTDPPRGSRNHRKSGHKKPGLNIGSAGITSVPGLFS